MNERAFTLLELMVSMTILSVIVVIILSGFRIGIRSWEVGERQAEKNQRLRMAAAQLSDEIRSAFALQIKGNIDDDDETVEPFNGFFGDANSLKFITSTIGLTPSPMGTRLRAVSYKVDSNGLVVVESYLNFEEFFEDPESVGEEIIINPDVSDISFLYWDCYTQTLEEEEEEKIEPEDICEWVDTWDPIEDLIKKSEMKSDEDKEKEETIDYQNLPRAVKVTLTLKSYTESGKDEELPALIIPIATGHTVDINPNES